MSERIIDVLIIGSGPAGLQAAVHAVRKKAEVVVLGKVERSAIYQAHVENYLCVPGVTDGSELMATALEQAQKFGAEVIAEDVLNIEQDGELYKVKIESGRQFMARTLIFATGNARKKLKVKGEKELSGKGVSYCVDCDANFYRNAKVAVVGNESAAVDGAITLTRYASEVHLVARKLEASPELRAELSQSPVQLHEGQWVKEIQGEQAVAGLVLENDTTLEVEGVFIELGAKGAMDLAATMGVAMDPETFSFIATNKKQETNMAGIYAAGDIAGPPWQMAKAVGEGCVAGWEAANFAAKQKRADAA
ncbi:NAD(P)/FAD-dependent oxidoreductase [Desulfurivibrio alkaliphilus]|uniref:FAD-dependent pyridine nucleotide-disulfide oxidoreductase n=1 Tax=Desulfurivibrio alkaliphilus (strain DSM 19089 / UNIQEM U267 / AHT2) TaxID=589865 RepID=D6Z6R0_DESAT|nr:FAD-dependent oxidoreductase [Desulfurivibrio alkaliphilus]ADH85019.1 FAD-dependent pyridine nucleotide-disulfide oxidoreductase [Desulfurivibrio alkaliphilus AHT 2]